MRNMQQIREGLPVIGPNGEDWGTVQQMRAGGFDARGLHYSENLVMRVGRDGVHVHGAGVAEGQDQLISAQEADEIRVELAEERLTVGKRAVERGEVNIRKTVVEEQQIVPVTLTQEEVRVQEVDTTDRPATAADNLFAEETFQVALRGQEAVVAKETIITGEVVIEKDAIAEERQITDTVRKQHVDVDRSTVTETTGGQTTTRRQGSDDTRKA